VKRILLSLLLIVATSIVGIPTAKAESKVYSKQTNTDTYNRSDINFKYDIQRVEVGLYDTDLDMLHFWILFAQPLTANMFNDNQGSWAGILIDTNNDGNDDIVLNTLAKTYVGNYYQAASGSYRNGSKSCTTQSWMDLNNSTNKWLGFKVSQKCLGLSNKFHVQAYADYISTDNASYDYAPDSYEVIDLGDYYNPKPKVTMSVPQTTSDIGKPLSNYSSAPENLVNLSASLRDSVATIECIVGNTEGSGTAWSAKVEIPISTYKSYLITNYHVISDCVVRGTVNVILNNNTKIIGTLAAWDPDNDVAGIYVTTYVPPLIWQGEQPVQGGWVGVIGSPKGLPGVLTTGIISSVSNADKYLTFTAPINPGNSGGPVFDSVGRVVAIATAKVRDTEGFAIGNGVPLICEVVVKCSSSLRGWGSKAITPTPTPTPTFKKLAQDRFVPEIDDVYLSKGSIVYIPFTTSYLPLSISSVDSDVCDYVLNYIKLKKPGQCTITVNQSGNAYYAPAESKYIDFEVLATKKTITCIKGKLVKKVTAVNPKCPAGYKKK
jgi:hypothetical protein